MTPFSHILVDPSPFTSQLTNASLHSNPPPGLDALTEDTEPVYIDCFARMPGPKLLIGLVQCHDYREECHGRQVKEGEIVIEVMMACEVALEFEDEFIVLNMGQESPRHTVRVTSS